jgi:hypothetical protein
MNKANPAGRVGCVLATFALWLVPQASQADFIALFTQREIGTHAAAEDDRTPFPGESDEDSLQTFLDGRWNVSLTSSAGDGAFSGEATATQNSSFRRLWMAGQGTVSSVTGGEYPHGMAQAGAESLLYFDFLVNEPTPFSFSASATGASNSGGGETAQYRIEVKLEAPMLGTTLASIVDIPGPGTFQFADQVTVTGILEPGISYRVSAYATAEASVFPASFAEASFRFGLSGGNVVFVPEPSAVTSLWIVALAAILRRRYLSSPGRCRPLADV